MTDTNTNSRIVNYASLNKFRELVTTAYNKAIADEFVAKVGELKDENGHSYTVAQVVGTPISVKTKEGKTVVISLKDLISAEVTRATNAESELTAEINKKADKATTIAGYNITDVYTKTEVNNELATKQDIIDDLATIRSDASTGAGLVTQVNTNKTNIASLQTAINTLNSAKTVEGSVDKKVADAIAAVVAEAPADFDTLKEIADYISSDKTSATTINNDISVLKTKVATIAENAEVNQNAFSNVTIGSTTITANSKTDTLTLEAGSGIDISADIASDKITVTNSGVRSVVAGTSANQISVNTNGTASTITINNVENATAATNDSAGQAISSTYIKNLSISGKVITYTKGDGTTETITTQDTIYTHPDSGVAAGTYRSVTVDVQGHVTAGTNPTTIADYGITDAYTKSEIDTKITTVSDKLVFATDADITAMFA